MKTAEKLYQKILKTYSDAYAAYDRLMVIYRKQKELKKELEVINLAIENFKSNYLEKQQDWIKKNETAAGLTRDLAISLGLMDKDGLPVVSDPMLIRWSKRKELLLKRFEKKSKNTSPASKTPKGKVRKKVPAAAARAKKTSRENN